MIPHEILSEILTLCFFLLLFLGFWFMLGCPLDFGLVIALNYALMVFWVLFIANDFSKGLAEKILIFIGIFYFSRIFMKVKFLPKFNDKIKRTIFNIDLSWVLIFFAGVSLYNYLANGLLSLEQKLLVESVQAEGFLKYFNYLTLSKSILFCHYFTRSFLFGWNYYSRTVVSIVFLTSFLTSSKASILPLFLMSFFIVSQFSLKKAILYCIISFPLVVGAVLYGLRKWVLPNQDFSGILNTIILRILGNTDVLDYIQLLGDKYSSYPFASMFYPFWPFFQFNVDGFINPGVWLHGTLYDDWRGFGPNPTFIGDFLIGSSLVWPVAAFCLGILYFSSRKTKYTVLVSLIVYYLLQDWYMGLIQLSGFLFFVAISAAFQAFTSGFKRRMVLPKNSSEIHQCSPVACSRYDNNLAD